MNLAYRNDPSVKKAVLNRLQASLEREKLTRGIGFYNEKNPWQPKGQLGFWLFGPPPDGILSEPWGEEENFLAECDRIGLPAILAGWYDHAFCELPYNQALEWAVSIIEIIPVGADLTKVWLRFAEWIVR